MDGVIDRLLRWAQTRPDAPALIGSGLRLRYADLLPGLRARAAWLHGSGVRAGDTVALAFARGQTIQEQVEIFYACIWLGAPVLPLYPEWRAEQQAAAIAQLNARWLVSPQRIGDTPCLPPQHFDTSLWAGESAPRGDAPERGFYFEFTSGTTGAPKAVCLSGAEFAASRQNAANAYGWQPDDVCMAALPWPTKVGIRGMLRTLWAGAAHLDQPYPHTRNELAALIALWGLNALDCSPLQLRVLMASPPLPDGQLLPLRWLRVVGAAIAPPEIQAARERLTRRLHIGYGSTELGLMAYLGPDDAPDAPYRLVPGLRVQALATDGQPLPDGQTGRLRLAAPWLPARYALGSSDAVEGFHNGYFVSSDLGAVVAPGRLVLQGRADHAINVGGLKVIPMDVEQALLNHPEVADVAVIGIPDPVVGEAVAAFLVLRSPLGVDLLRQYLFERLAPEQVPGIYVGLQTIPRSPEGKVLAQPLRELFAARMREFKARP